MKKEKNLGDFFKVVNSIKKIYEGSEMDDNIKRLFIREFAPVCLIVMLVNSVIYKDVATLLVSTLFIVGGVTYNKLFSKSINTDDYFEKYSFTKLTSDYLVYSILVLVIINEFFKVPFTTIRIVVMMGYAYFKLQSIRKKVLKHYPDYGIEYNEHNLNKIKL